MVILRFCLLTSRMRQGETIFSKISSLVKSNGTPLIKPSQERKESGINAIRLSATSSGRVRIWLADVELARTTETCCLPELKTSRIWLFENFRKRILPILVAFKRGVLGSN